MESKNIIQEFLNDIIGDHRQFSPNEHFYKSTRIKCKRWGQIYRNEKSPTLQELYDISAYFKKALNVITDKRQLKIDFDSTEKTELTLNI